MRQLDKKHVWTAAIAGLVVLAAATAAAVALAQGDPTSVVNNTTAKVDQTKERALNDTTDTQGGILPPAPAASHLPALAASASAIARVS